jgi:hypothetical protein
MFPAMFHPSRELTMVLQAVAESGKGIVIAGAVGPTGMNDEYGRFVWGENKSENDRVFMTKSYIDVRIWCADTDIHTCIHTYTLCVCVCV